jgi:hypothetical protein
VRRRALLAVVLWLGLAPCARAERLDETARARADAAFSEWRLADLDAILEGGSTPLDLEPLLVRDLYWRPDARFERGGRPEASGQGLSERRWAWLSSGGKDPAGGRIPYPVPGPGETEPYPRITALVLDRVHREGPGARGLSEGSPLAAAGWARGHLDTRRAAFTGYPPDAAAARRLASATSRNRALGLGAVAVLLAAWAVAFRAARRGTGPAASGAGP